MKKLIIEIENLLRECGDVILNADRGRIAVDEKSGHANFVTYYDRMIQEKIRERLKILLPEAAFVGEEEDVHEKIREGFSFIVDPIDGTTNFIRDLRCSTVSVGLLRDGEPYIGVIYNPYTDEMFTGLKGEGSYLNGVRMHVSRKAFRDSIVLFGTSPYYAELNEEGFRKAAFYAREALDVRRFGSAAYDLALVAAGKAEIFFELRLSPWDYAAGSLLISEAGGTVTQTDGSPLSFSEPSSVYARGQIRDIPPEAQEDLESRREVKP